MKTFIKCFFIAIIPIIIFIGCQEVDLENAKIPDGIYLGTFVRDFVWTDNNIANISITFSSNTWIGTSDMVKYPALCNGTYSVQGNKIVFQNNCAWTAEFDWSLILSGEYDHIIKNNSIEFFRDYRSETSDTYVDIYKITKQSD